VVRRIVTPDPPSPDEERLQPGLGLEDADEAPGPSREPESPVSLPLPAVSVDHKSSRTGLASLFGMLLIGFLLGIPAGYLMAPKAGQTAAQQTQPPREAAPPTTTPAAALPPAAPLVEPPAATPSAAPGGVAVAPRPELTRPMAPAAADKTPKKPAPHAVARQPVKPDVARGAAATGGQTAPATKKAAATPPVAFEGSLVIASKPDGASVLVDGRPVGTTPMTVPSLSAGSHAIRLELAGYNVWTSSVRVAAGKMNRVTASLERRPGG